MIYITTALQCEARPLIQHFNLRQDQAANQYRRYANGEITVIVTGVGKTRAATAINHLLSAENSRDLSRSVIVNFGVCGAVRKDSLVIGDMVVVNQIQDNACGRAYFPDMLLKHDFKEAGIETFDSPVGDTSTPALPLVDMEASGFFEAASEHFSPDRIMCIKIISDFLEPKRVSNKQVATLIESCINNLTQLFRAFHELIPPAEKVLGPDDETILDQLNSRFRFTSTQRHLLRRSAEAFAVRTGSTLDSFKTSRTSDPSSKHEVKRIFNSLRDSLDQS